MTDLDKLRDIRMRSKKHASPEDIRFLLGEIDKLKLALFNERLKNKDLEAKLGDQ